VIKLLNFKAAFAALILSTIFTTSLNANYIFDDDGLIPEKAQTKLAQMGNELYSKTGVSTVLVIRKHLDQKSFLEIKDRYLKELTKPYVLWIFSKTYINQTNVGINKMFSSDDVKDKFNEDSIFSPWSGSFTKLIVIQKSKSDPTPAAFLNGYGDLTDMIAKSYNIKLDSSMGSETRTTIGFARIIFYLVTLFFLVYYIRVKYFKKGNK
jgi:hypothetical protein